MAVEIASKAFKEWGLYRPVVSFNDGDGRDRFSCIAIYQYLLHVALSRTAGNEYEASLVQGGTSFFTYPFLRLIMETSRRSISQVCSKIMSWLRCLLTSETDLSVSLALELKGGPMFIMWIVR